MKLKLFGARAGQVSIVLALLLSVALFPGAASAQSVDPFFQATPYAASATYASNPVYVLDQSTGTLAFGNGVTGNTVPSGTSVSAAYATGSGASGNVPAATWFACLFMPC